MFTSAASRRWLCAAALCVAAFAAVTGWVRYADGPTGFDLQLMTAALGVRTAVLTQLATLLTMLGSFPVVAVVAGTVATLLWWRTGRLLLPLTMLITVIETAAIVFLIKMVVGRDRPPTQWLIGAPSADGSFPSGHTTNGSVVYLLAAALVASTLQLLWLRRVLLLTAATIAVTIGVTRVYLGYHWATDVLGGWLLATALCSAAAFAVCRLSPDAMIKPSATIGPAATVERPAPRPAAPSPGQRTQVHRV